MNQIAEYLDRKNRRQMSEPAFFEMARLVTQGDPNLQNQVIERLANSDEVSKFQTILRRQQLPNVLTLKLDTSRQGDKSSHMYYRGRQTIKNDKLRIHFVQDVHSMDRMIDYFMVCMFIFFYFQMFCLFDSNPSA